ncbi:hypothetical protein [Pseudonocardia sp. TMWB2A]|uniref:hypothetical protein n=1 Tax=Pseudonocardia sp. TMWB2A TaxID=687430 RepID=UPI00307EEC4E
MSDDAEWVVDAAADELDRLRAELDRHRVAGDGVAESTNALLAKLPYFVGNKVAQAEREACVEADNAWRSVRGDAPAAAAADSGAAGSNLEDAPAAGRDLTALDVADAWALKPPGLPMDGDLVADYLNRITRPAAAPTDEPTTAAGWGRHDGLVAYLKRSSWTIDRADDPIPPAGAEGVVGAWFERKLHSIAHAMIRDGFMRSGAAAAPTDGQARRTDVGRCGARPPSPLYGCTTLTTVCELDAGHPGWHRDGSSEWGPAAPTDGQAPADMPDEFGPYLRAAMQRPEFRRALDDVQVRDELRSAAWEAFQHPTGFDDGAPENVQEAVEVAADAVIDLLAERTAAAAADDTAAPTGVAALFRRCEEIDRTTWRADGDPAGGGQISTAEVWQLLAAPADDTAAPDGLVTLPIDELVWVKEWKTRPTASWRCLLAKSTQDEGYVSGACRFDHQHDTREDAYADALDHLQRWHHLAGQPVRNSQDGAGS